MALPENTGVSQVDKPTNDGYKPDRREKPPTKVIVRRLPPSITLEEFVTQVAPLPEYDYIYAIKADMSLGENAFSRVYINFVNTEDIYMFKEKFDNYVFVDSKGHEYAAVVEFASFQKIPKKRGKTRPDLKVASIETSPLYLSFVESLKHQPSQDEKPEYSYQPSTDNKNDSSTPLLDYLKQRKFDRLKSREEKREERRRREIERKKFRDEEKRKKFEEKSPTKTVIIKQNKTEVEKPVQKQDDIEKPEKSVEKPEKFYEKSASFKAKERKYDDYKPGVKPKSKYSPRQDKYDTYEKRDFKSRRDDYRERNRHYDDSRKDEGKKELEQKQFSAKKVKKYSERREERKLEYKKSEQKKEELPGAKEIEAQEKDCPEAEKPVKVDEENDKIKEEKKLNRDDREDSKSDDQEKTRNKENDPRMQRRIRNKDRPTMQLYQPGMLSKRRQHGDDIDSKDQGKE